MLLGLMVLTDGDGPPCMHWYPKPPVMNKRV